MPSYLVTSGIVSATSKPDMARRRRDADYIGLVVQMTGVVMLLSLLSPQVRQIIFSIGFLAVLLSWLRAYGTRGVWRLHICQTVPNGRSQQTQPRGGAIMLGNESRAGGILMQSDIRLA